MAELLFVTAIFLLLLGAASFYFYARITYNEKKIALLETILLDIKMMVEMESGPPPPPPSKHNMEYQPAGPNSDVIITDAPNVEKPETDATAYYASVIEGVVDANVVPEVAASVQGVNYDSYSRDEIAALAEKRGLRITKRMNKQTLITMMRESDKNTSGKVELGTDGAPADGGAALDGAEELSSESL